MIEDATLEALNAGIRRCTACPLYRSRTHAVPGEGDPRAQAMLIGEAPGEVEDAVGAPFRGRSGRYLDRLLAGVGLSREDFYITGSVKCRPPRNRDPRPEELTTCRHLWLDRQIEWIDPAILVLMGRIPLRLMLDERRTLRGLHGTVRPLGGRRCLIIYHPAAAMRFPEARMAMEADFRALRQMIEALG